MNHAWYSPHSQIFHLVRKEVKFTLEQALKAQRYCLTSALVGAGGQCHAAAALPLE